MRKANKNIVPAIDSISLYGGVENTRYFYHGDHLGSSSWITDKDGNALQYISYLPYGQLFMNLKTTSYDARNLLAQITTNLGNTNFVYNAVGELLHSTDPENNTTDFNYDNFGRIVSRTSPDAGTHSFTYDKAGNIVQENNNGKITNYVYNYIQNTQIQFPANTENNIKFTWGNNTATNNRKGRIYLIEDINGWTQYDYDIFGNVAKKQKTVVLPNENDSYNFYISYSFDYFGRVKTITHQDSEVITYNYDLGGNLYSVQGVKSSQNNGTTEYYNYIDSIYYNKFGKRTLVYYGNNCYNAYSYDNMQRLKTLKTRAKINTSNEENLQSLFYNYDAVGNILSIRNIAELVSMNPLTSEYYDSYSYDGAYRLVSAQMSRTYNNQVKTNNASYQYSNNGKILNMQNNRTTVIGGLSLVSNSSQSYNYQNNNNKLQRTTLTTLGALSNNFTDYLYDACGNMTVAGTKKTTNGVTTTLNKRRLYWNERNQMQAVQDTNYSSFYFYDYGGERTWKISGAKLSTTRNGVTTKYNIFNNSTLYVFPELTVNSQSYIKHIFAESERICSKIGKGRPSGNPINNVPINVSANDISAKKAAQKDFIKKIYTNLCIPTPLTACRANINNGNVMSINRLKPTIDSISIYRGIENSRYFYHGDHLGSSSWITDKDGNALQYIGYLPYGQLFMNLKTTSYDASYKFIGKERDAETSFDYFGARYYSNTWAIWLSVDPLADKYPSLSPYNYCAGNPVKYLDPNGMDVENAYSERRDKAQQRLDIAKTNLESFNGNNKAEGYKQAKKEFKQANNSFNNINDLYSQVDHAITDLKTYNSELFNDLDNLIDKNGNTIDVYIEIASGLVGSDGQSLKGRSTTKYSNGTFSSKYGLNTGLIEINSNVIDKGQILSHEGGHQVYAVTKTMEYLKWCQSYHGPQDGHSGGNPSGKYADYMEKTYINNKKSMR